MTELKPIQARLTNDQWTALGRFQAALSEILLPDIEYKFEIYFFDLYQKSPTVHIELRVPGEGFSRYDDAITKAFDDAKVPGYRWDGPGHDIEKQIDTRHGLVWSRDITFAEIKTR